MSQFSPWEGGEIPYKNYGGALWKFSKKSLRGINMNRVLCFFHLFPYNDHFYYQFTERAVFYFLLSGVTKEAAEAAYIKKVEELKNA